MQAARTTDLAEQIDEFIEHVDDYLLWTADIGFIDEDFRELTTSRKPEETDVRQYAEGRAKSEDYRLKSRASILKCGRGLAPALARAGFPSQGVRKIVHRADGGGRPQPVASAWEAVKIELQKIVDERREAAVTTDPKRLDPIDAEIISVMQIWHSKNEERKSQGKKPTRRPGCKVIADHLRLKRMENDELHEALKANRVKSISRPWVIERVKALDPVLSQYLNDCDYGCAATLGDGAAAVRSDGTMPRSHLAKRQQPVKDRDDN